MSDMKHNLLFLCAAAMGLAACTQDELADGTRLPEGQYPLEIAGITLSVEGGEAQPWGAPQTRVSENAYGTGSVFDMNNQFSVQIEGDTQTAIYTVQDDGSVMADNLLFWSDRDDHTVNAWYPATDGTLDLRDQDTNGLAYLLHGTGTGDYQTPVTLTFTHSLAKVRVTPSDAIGDNEVTSLQLYTYRTCTYNQGKVVRGTNEGWIEMKQYKYSENGNTITCWEANVVPGYEITKLMANRDGKERKLSATINPEAGNFYNITLNNDKGYTIDAQGNYNVYSEAGLKAWAEALQENNSLNITLTDDITLTPPAAGESNWSPKWGYDGVFDGNGKTITGLTIEYGTATYAGLFATLGENGKVKNLTLKNANITAATYTGAVAGMNNGTIENCSVSGTVESSSNNAGGITGYNYGTITGCSVSGNVSANSQAGGIAGYLVTGDITDCHSSATVKGNYLVGGVAGYMSDNTTLTACFSTGSVTATGSGDAEAGGVVGRVTKDATVTACYATGNVTATQGSNAGGVAGASGGGTITACYHATGTVSGPARVGGVLGWNQTGIDLSGIVIACYWDNNQSSGIGEDQTGNGEATKVTSGDWTAAKNAMNEALTNAGWQYVTGGSDAPLTLRKQ